MKKLIFFALMCMSLSQISCDKLKEATSTDFKVNDARFEFSAESKASASEMPAGEAFMRAATAVTQSFSVTRMVNISELGSDELIEYKNKISKVIVDNSLINVTVSPSGAYTVEKLTITAVGVSGSIVIPSYTIGSPFTLTSDMNAFTIALLLKLLNDNSVSVTVSGKTDAPVGTTINVRYESDLIFTASLL